MTPLLRSLVLAAGMAGLLVAGGTSVAPAQEKKGTKAAKTGGAIEVNEGKDGKFRFVIRDAEGKLLAMSGPTGFATKDDAVAALETLKDVLPTAKVTTGKKDGGKAKDGDKAKGKTEKK